MTWILVVVLASSAGFRSSPVTVEYGYTSKKVCEKKADENIARMRFHPTPRDFVYVCIPATGSVDIYVCPPYERDKNGKCEDAAGNKIKCGRSCGMEIAK